MGTILEEITEQTERDLKKRMREVSLRELESMEDFERTRRDFPGALGDGRSPAVIAEIKKASPSVGVIREDFDPRSLARSYERGGAAALSVLTDGPAFGGSLQHLRDASRAVNLPLLRKDFVIDPYQVKEARAWGADAVLLIATITEGAQLEELLHAAEEFELHALVECYSEEDLSLVPWKQVRTLGVNNRDLRDFSVDLHRGIRLLHTAPEGTLLVSESGLSTAEDLLLLRREGIHAALIGEYFMRQADPGRAVRQLLDEVERGIGEAGAGEGGRKQDGKDN